MKIDLNKTLIASLTVGISLCNLSCTNDDDMDMPDNGDIASLFVSSNTSGMISIMDFTDPSNVSTSTTASAGADADGIYYDAEDDEIIQLVRSNNSLNVYGDFKASLMNSGISISLGLNTMGDFVSGREIAVYNDMVVVAESPVEANGNQSSFYVYQTTSSGFSLMNTYRVDFALWGIHIEGNTLYAIVDKDSDLAVFNNFFANADGMINPSKRVTIEGLVRTHGLTYSMEDDLMVLTDIGDAGSDSDGGLTLITDFSNKLNATSNGGMISSSQQARIEGSNTSLGNPVDVAYSEDSQMIFVAERANGGGKILAFNYFTSNGNPSPTFSQSVEGASAVYYYED
ncbi:hypothetical protein IFO69_18395 [Echinicola sp. CAU 1574]|uniref:Uncharacterized protein n=1 Tax=Echinicola arenosa TaxID=2774144 RepID=A0ABR9ASZ4_9BACT|nr:hypothetical protein [Echinicola arenosa]MBD8490729.1 hypothetical protein [Echinicola arenosa]